MCAYDKAAAGFLPVCQHPRGPRNQTPQHLWPEKKECNKDGATTFSKKGEGGYADFGCLQHPIECRK